MDDLPPERKSALPAGESPAAEAGSLEPVEPQVPGRLAKTAPSVLHGSIRRTVLWLAMPVLLEQLLSFLVGFYDTWLAGQISADATSAIGLGAYVGWLASMISGLVATGTTALVSRHWGAAEYDDANRVMNSSIALAALAGVLMVAGIFVAAPGLSAALGMTGPLEEIAIRYLRMDGAGHLVTGITLAGAAALRGAGDMRSPMMILGVVNLLNIVASRTFVYGIGPLPWLSPGTPLLEPMGVDGIVAGTVLARLAGGCLMLAGLAYGLSGLKLKRGLLWPTRETATRILRIGGPAAFDGGVMWMGQLLFLKVIAGLGGDSVNSAIFAAHIIGVRVEAISYLPATAWGVAAATMIGQSLGARNPQRAVRSGNEAVLQCSLLGILVAAVFWVGAGPIYELMHEDAAVRAAGIPAFRQLALFQIPLMVSIVYVIGLRGAGETRLPLVITLLGTFCVRVPLAWLLGIHYGGGLTGAWAGMCADMLLRAVLLAAVYHYGSWTRTEV